MIFQGGSRYGKSDPPYGGILDLKENEMNGLFSGCPEIIGLAGCVEFAKVVGKFEKEFDKIHKKIFELESKRLEK